MTMASCTEDEQDEFFETLDVIAASSPSSESEGGGDERCRHSVAVVEASVQRRQILSSEYGVWQNQTSSILERRQRLLSNMGIRLERENSKRACGSINFAENRSWGVSSESREEDATGSKRCSVGFSNLSDSLKAQESTIPSGEGFSREVIDHVDIVASKTSTDRSLDAISSSATSCVPVHSCGKSSIQADGNLKSSVPSLNRHEFPASRLESRHVKGQNNGIGRSESLQEATLLNQFSSNVGSLNFSPDYATLSEDDNTAQTQSRMQNGATFPDGKVALQSMQGIEVLCRIKDLDSGKEFVVNAGSEDGSWSKVKELKTGQELTLEEFQSSLGFSPIVQEVMKREQVSDCSGAIDAQVDIEDGAEKKRTWLKTIKDFVNSSHDKNQHKSGGNSRLPSLEKSGRRSSTESSDSQDSAPQVVKQIKVHTYRKRSKDFSNLYLRQEIQAHEGAIWTMKFNFDGSLLASAGQDTVVRVWEAVGHRDSRSLSDITGDSFPIIEQSSESPLHCPNQIGSAKESVSTLSNPRWSSKPFWLVEKPKHVLCGHSDDISDLSWSRSQLLLSSSMDKTVRLWNGLSGLCLRVFDHNDYVTCIHFNPVDDGYFISGSLDGKVRIWSITDRQVVDWVDLCEMVTAACYKQNGQGAVVGSYKGTCHFYKIIDSKLQFDQKFQVQRKRKKRSQKKKITGLQFVPGDNEKLLITSSDSRIRVYDGSKVCSKYVGLRNGNSQISASLSSNGTFVICASEDSSVCIWKYYDSNLHSIQKQKSLSRSYEHFFVQSVSVAIPWPGSGLSLSSGNLKADENSEIKGSDIAEEKHEVKMACKSCLARDEKSVNHNVNEHTCDKSSRRLLPDSEHLSYLDDGETVVPSCSTLDSYLQGCYSELSNAGYNEQNDNLSLSSERESAGWAEGGVPSASLAKKSSHENRVAVTSSEDAAHKNISGVATSWGLVFVTAGLGVIHTWMDHNHPSKGCKDVCSLGALAAYFWLGATLVNQGSWLLGSANYKYAIDLSRLL